LLLLGSKLHDFIDARRSRASFQRFTHSRELLMVATGQYFYSAVVVVAHPSTHADRPSLALDEPAKAYALYASGDDVATSHENKL
jgi:hypothetical protein